MFHPRRDGLAGNGAQNVDEKGVGVLGHGELVLEGGDRVGVVAYAISAEAAALRFAERREILGL